MQELKEETADVKTEVLDWEKVVVQKEVEGGTDKLAGDSMKLRRVGEEGDEKSSENISGSGELDKADLDGIEELDVRGTEMVSAISTADVGAGSFIRIFILSRLSTIFFSWATPYPLGFLNGTSGSPSTKKSLFRLYGKGVSLPVVSPILNETYFSIILRNCILSWPSFPYMVYPIMFHYPLLNQVIMAMWKSYSFYRPKLWDV